ncbi:DUF1015 family protein [Myxococcota bacterium]|nr:DUF1015 family protein [Myxococcota bacterium]
MVDFRALRALRPKNEEAAQIAAVPYDVVDTAEARALVASAPHSILRVTRPDVDLPDGASLYAPAAYAQAKATFEAMIAEGALVQDPSPAFFAYAQTMDNRRQVGLMGLASAADYWADKIKKHEFTRPQKEDDRMRHIEALGAHLGPVFLAYRAQPQISALIDAVIAPPAEVDFIAPDGVRHEVWPIREAAQIEALEGAFAQLDALYIADGHHRAAAASRIGRDHPNTPRGQFLAVAFPDDQLKILPYNRVVLDLNGHTPEGLKAALAAIFEITPLTEATAPTARQRFSMYLDGAWSALALKPEAAPDPTDPVASLDVSVLQSRVLGPLLGIDDPRRSERIDFVGGIRGLAELARRAAAGGVAFALYPTSLAELMAIADSGEVMPPKSTWFEPKLRTGLAISRF